MADLGLMKRAPAGLGRPRANACIINAARRWALRPGYIWESREERYGVVPWAQHTASHNSQARLSTCAVFALTPCSAPSSMTSAMRNIAVWFAEKAISPPLSVKHAPLRRVISRYALPRAVSAALGATGGEEAF